MAAGLIAESAKEEVRADTALQLGLIQQFDIGPMLFPLPVAVLGYRPEAARAVRRLDPSGLLGLAFKAVFAHQIEKKRRRPADEIDEAFARRAEPCRQIVGVGAGQYRYHLPVISARRTEADIFRLQNGDGFPGLRQMQGRGEPGKSGPDDRDVGLNVALEGFELRTGRRESPPEGCLSCHGDDLYRALIPESAARAPGMAIY